MKYVAGPRREIGLRTIFNILGPLTNPAGATVQVLGVYSEDLTEKLGRVLQKLGCKGAFVVYGEGSYDELSITGPSKITRVTNGNVETTTVVPEDVGLKRALPEEIRGGDARENAAIVRSVLEGEKGARRDMVLLNAAAAFVAAGEAKDLQEGIAIATKSIDSGCALEKLDKLVSMGTFEAAASGNPTGWGWSSR
jgi:anthranilate phosphoribosyltransferase